ncbi:MAG: 2-keto-4-pentenoate hydratase [Chloroflexi bacterium]|nr:2-keto-4-pentenoate hydratase [Chloroflexota bacterium]
MTTPQRTAELDRLADGLRIAERTRIPIDQITAGRPWLTPVDAYAIQERLVRPRLAAGETLEGWKIGLTAKAMQEQLGVDQPDYGAILSGWVVPDGATLALDALIAPRVEAEICFRLARPLRGPGITVDDVLAATAGVSAAIEVIDSRIRDWKLTLVDTIADMASSARIVVAETSVPVEGIDLRAVGVTVLRDGEPVATGVGAACLGDPAAAVAWAANTLGALGVTLEAGHIVMPGALHASVPVTGTSRFEARFEGIGSVTIGFESGRPGGTDHAS